MTPVLAATGPDIAVFAVAATMCIVGALGVIISRNPVHSALWLVLTLFGIATTFIAQEAQFLAAVQVIVYAGAIVVLFLFVIMLLGVDKVEQASPDRMPGLKSVAAVIGLGIAGLIVGLGNWWSATGTPSLGGTLSGPGSNVAKLADSIFTDYAFAFEATSLLLIIAVVGAVVLARKPTAGDAGVTEEEKVDTAS